MGFMENARRGMGNYGGVAPTDLIHESFALFAVKSFLLRALRVLRGEYFFTGNPEEPKKKSINVPALIVARRSLPARRDLLLRRYVPAARRRLLGRLLGWRCSRQGLVAHEA